MTRQLTVETPSRAYDIHIRAGALAEADRWIAPLLARPRLALVADAAVIEPHAKRLIASLEGAGIAVSLIAIPGGEAAKRFDRLEALCGQLLEAGVERDDLIAALGGGVIGDLVGFAAAILRRGVGFVQIPTTLLAQVDSSVGGKTGINMPQGKNLIGAFHQPRLVLIDPQTLATLPDRERRAGFAEVIKYGLIDRPDFFAWLEQAGPAVLAGEADALERALFESCAAKAAVVAADEREAGARALLNLGHTFGHGLEALGGYDGRLLHGEAVALGMALALRFSVAQGLCPAQEAQRAQALIARSGLPVRLADLPFQVTADDLLATMRQDKKVVDGAITLILARGIGRAFIARAVPQDAILAFLTDEAGRASAAAPPLADPRPAL